MSECEKQVEIAWSIMYEYRKQQSALAAVAQCIECRPANQRVAGSIPSQDTSLGCRPGPKLGACERQPHIDVSLSPTLPLCLKINK